MVNFKAYIVQRASIGIKQGESESWVYIHAYNILTDKQTV